MGKRSFKYAAEESNKARKQRKWLMKKDNPQWIKTKAKIDIIRDDPYEGDSSIERLRNYDDEKVYSIRIDKKNRIVYEIIDSELILYFYSVHNHYNDR